MSFSSPENVLNGRMASRDLAIATIYLSQMTVGILGNFSLLYHDLCHYYTEGHAWRPIHLILTGMAVAAFLVLLYKGIPQTIPTWELSPNLGNTGYKLIYYIHRMFPVATGLLAEAWAGIKC
uniref:Vomeronasal type-1 receptor n=1 Tax=Neovison vison TaxID=452646 RepID=A0A8C7CA60_NEOVI